MKTKLSLFFILILFSCKHTDNKINVDISYDLVSQYLIIKNNSTNHCYGFYNSFYTDLFVNYGYKEPIFCFDSLNKLLYVYDIAPLRGIRVYDIEKDTLIKEVPINFSYREHYNIKMYCLNSLFILKSNWRFDIWEKEFSHKTSLKDTLFKNFPICYRYTLDYLPEVRNDTLFLTVLYEGGIVDTILHNSNYVYDLRKKEFITKIEPCEKILSKGIP